ncbi:hypothetical protein E2562_015977 [Oryza meyeriana var. granulata]|uniref:Uncharacterized protein n=1 Tax=Oryza meyeriana var. granulata TaxID=110450 RepID=A0A6G1EKK0_9ORYZ|nr:hypothetical protein E2562_015977 [Oryza meyeriana var. granulata]
MEQERRQRADDKRHKVARLRLGAVDGRGGVGRSLKATVLNANITVVTYDAIHFESDLQHYGTQGNVLRDPAEPGHVVSPPLMSVEWRATRWRCSKAVATPLVVGGVGWGGGAGGEGAELT